MSEREPTIPEMANAAAEAASREIEAVEVILGRREQGPVVDSLSMHDWAAHDRGAEIDIHRWRAHCLLTLWSKLHNRKLVPTQSAAIS